MADYGLSGGGEHCLIYRIKADHTGVVQADGTTTATSNAHAVLEITTGLEEPQFNVDGFTLNIVKNDDALTAFTKAYRPASTSTEVDGEVRYGEAGTKWDVDADASSADPLLIVYAGGISGEGGKRFCLCGIGTLDPASENYTTKYKSWSVRALTFNPINAKTAISIINGLLPTGKFGAAVTMTIASGAIWEQDFLSTT